MPYELYYWPASQGRGEFVRLALEQAGCDYIDVGRVHGREAIVQALTAADTRPRPFAAPLLKDGALTIAQTAAILMYLGPRLDLAPADEAGRLWTHQIQLTIADLVAEIHATHHPLDGALYYEEQKDAALRRATGFRNVRLPKFLAWLEAILTDGAGGWLVGGGLTYADLSAFQVVEGLRYAFPRATATTLAQTPRLVALAARVRALPNIAAYLQSPRRLAFNENGIFRHYPELDAGA